MSRSIQEIKNEVTQEFMRNETAAALYGFEAGSAFSNVFSPGSIENILLYVWSVCCWVVEGLFDRHKQEILTSIEQMIPHRPKWYRDKVLLFMFGKELETDSDQYDLTGMSEEDISAMRVVRHAVATESMDASLLTIKVASEEKGERCPLTQEQERALNAYIQEIKDAGVRINLINADADLFNCVVEVYYNALMQPDTVQAECMQAIREYIQNLPFNGEYTNMALVDKLQTVEGVKIVELIESSSKAEGEDTITEINARMIPAAGYFKPGKITVNMKAYNEQA